MPKGIKNEFGLDEREENFCLEYLKSGDNSSAAYREAFKPKPSVKQESIWQGASRLLARPEIKARIATLKAEAAKGRGITVMDLVDEYAEAWRLAKDIAQPSSMVAATKAKAELLGLNKQTHVFESPDGSPLLPAFIQLVGPNGETAQVETDDEDGDE